MGLGDLFRKNPPADIEKKASKSQAISPAQSAQEETRKRVEQEDSAQKTALERASRLKREEQRISEQQAKDRIEEAKAKLQKDSQGKLEKLKREIEGRQKQGVPAQPTATKAPGSVAGSPSADNIMKGTQGRSVGSKEYRAPAGANVPTPLNTAVAGPAGSHVGKFSHLGSKPPQNWVGREKIKPKADASGGDYRARLRAAEDARKPKEVKAHKHKLQRSNTAPVIQAAEVKTPAKKEVVGKHTARLARAPTRRPSQPPRPTTPGRGKTR